MIESKNSRKIGGKHMALYSVVVPVYNSEHTLNELYSRLEKVFREEIQQPFELILVDDGSKDHSFQVMTELRKKDHRVKIIQMARNFGQHPMRQAILSSPWTMTYSIRQKNFLK